MDSHALLPPVRAPTELAGEQSAISADLDTTSVLSKNRLGSSLQPLREPANAHHIVTDVETDEAVSISSCVSELKNLGYFDLLCKKLLKIQNYALD